MKRYILFCLLACLGSLFPAAGQTTSGNVDYHLNHNPGDLRVATPNAATFNKYVNNPVDLYSGTARVDIPIYTLKDGAVTIPISLTYATTGIKVSEEASWVGLGWNLSVGGYITRRVVGKVDRYSSDPYYEDVIDAYDPDRNLTNSNYVYGGWSTQMREAMDWYLTEPARRKDYNREGRLNPDVFNYSCPDGSGMFVIDWRDNNIYQLNRTQDVKIEKILTSATNLGQPSNTNGAHLTGFKLTFPNGVMHRFDLKSTMITSSPVNLGVQAETYALTQTTYPNGQQVNYTYTTVTNRSFNYGETFKSMLPSTGVGLEGTGNSANGTMEHSYSFRSFSDFTGLELFLSQITTDNYQVTFTTSTREDLPEVRKLDRIQVKALVTGATCHDQRFAYSYFTSTTVGDYWSRYETLFSAYRQTNHMLKRLRLDATYNMDGSTEGERYLFVYDSKTLPRKDSYAVDYWGYYNGQTTNKSFIPDLYYLMLNHYNDYLKMSDLPTDNGHQLQKALRAYDFESCKACILTGIQYPTGGYSEIVYEPHRFTGDYIPTVAQCQSKPDNLIQTETIYDNNSFFAPDDLYDTAKNYSYNFSKDMTVRILLTLSRGQNSWQTVANHRAYLYYVKNGTEQRADFSMKEECEERYQKEEVSHSDSPTTTLAKEFTATVPAGTGWFIVDFPDELGDQTTGSGTNGRIDMLIEFEKEGAPEVESESEGAGVRVKEVNFYDSPSKRTLLQKTSYEYTLPGSTATSGVLLNKLQFVNYYRETYDKLGKYRDYNTCGFREVDMIARRSDKLEIAGYNYFSSPYQASADVGYTYVKEIVQGNGQNGYTQYAYHNEEPKTREHSVPLYDALNGKLQERSFYDASGTLLRKETFVYESPVYHYYYGMNFYDRINLFPELYSSVQGWQCMEMDDNTDDNVYLIACGAAGAVQAYMKFSQDKFEGRYLGGGARLAMVVHPLNCHNILLTSKTTWEDGVSTTETYSYNSTTLQLKSRETTLSPEGTVRITYAYPNDCPWGVYSSMNNKHFISPVVEEKKIVGGKLVESVLTEYKKLTDNLFVPSNRYRSRISSGLSSGTATFSSGGRDTTVYPIAYVTYNEYDSYGNALNLTEGGIEKTYLWSYKGQYPVAEITGATYAQVKSALGSLTPDSLSASATPNVNVLQSLPTKLPDANVTLYEYKAGAGVSQKTEANGEHTTYEYDGLNRLKKEKDHNGKTVNDYEYHYK